jgi:acyl-coenzyme A thioesterase PaaI-like protein
MLEPADRLLNELSEILSVKWGERVKDYRLPPPVFTTMQGELLEIDLEHETLTARFPIQEAFLNPYGTMQGGMIAAAVDNTLGPLSVLVAPPNVTRSLEMKYSRPAIPEMEYVVVQGKLVERAEPRLVFEARVSSLDGQKLATCRAVHWIIGLPRPETSG